MDRGEDGEYPKEVNCQYKDPVMEGWRARLIQGTGN